MSEAILQRAEDLTPSLATKLLTAKGALSAGRVVSIDATPVEEQRGFVANVARLRPMYSTDAVGPRPHSLFLKTSKPNPVAGRPRVDVREVNFYRAVGSGADLAIPLVYSAEANANGDTHVLMEDLTASHALRPAPVPPSFAQCDAIAVALGKLHAYWWNSKRFDTDLGVRSPTRLDDGARQRLATSYSLLANDFGDALLQSQRQMFERVLVSGFFDRITARIAARQKVTLVHGDLHAGNLMFPIAAGGDIVLIDWHQWSVNLAPYDLAFLIAMHWTQERRDLLERRLVVLYHDTLLSHGVDDYSFEELWNDYRCAVVACLFLCAEYYRRRMPPRIVWHTLQYVSAAFSDLDCFELL